MVYRGHSISHSRAIAPIARFGFFPWLGRLGAWALSSLQVHAMRASSAVPQRLRQASGGGPAVALDLFNIFACVAQWPSGALFPFLGEGSP